MTQPASPLSAVVLGDSPVKLWGMSSRERLRRLLVRAGVTLLDTLDSVTDGSTVVLLRADWVYDEPLLKALLAAAQGTLLLDPEGRVPVAAVASSPQARPLADDLLAGRISIGYDARTPATLASHYNNKLRKRETPYLLPLTAETLPAIENRMFSGSYKGVTDLVTKYVWPRPAQHVTKLCALAGLTPNQVTFASFLLTLAAFALFWNGQFGAGLICAWGMTFLDTVDGKLARVTLTSSKIGDVFDHGIDLVHPPFWYWAWVHGLQVVGKPVAFEAWVLGIVVAGYVLQRVQEGLFIKCFGIEIHIWRPFDSFFRLITARRNPNLILLMIGFILTRPDWGMFAVAVWTLIGLIVHGTQLVQAAFARRKGPLVSWLSR